MLSWPCACALCCRRRYHRPNLARRLLRADGGAALEVPDAYGCAGRQAELAGRVSAACVGATAEASWQAGGSVTLCQRQADLKSCPPATGALKVHCNNISAGPHIALHCRQSPLLVAVDCPETVRMLLEAGATPNVCSPRDGQTALCLAIRCGPQESALLLIDHGATPDLAALQAAQARGLESVVACLIRAAPGLGTPSPARCCANCGAAAAPDGGKLKACSRCHRERYCGRACQVGWGAACWQALVCRHPCRAAALFAASHVAGPTPPPSCRRHDGVRDTSTSVAAAPPEQAPAAWRHIAQQLRGIPHCRWHLPLHTNAC